VNIRKTIRSHNAGIPGFFKDEHAGGGDKPDQEIKTYCALRAKCYSIVFYGEEDTNKVTCKGVSSAAKSHLTHDLFLGALRGETTSTSCGVLKFRNHHIFQETLKRVALVPFDDKGYLLDDMITCLAHGHYKTFELLGKEYPEYYPRAEPKNYFAEEERIHAELWAAANRPYYQLDELSMTEIEEDSDEEERVDEFDEDDCCDF